MSNRDLITPAQAAEELGVNVVTVRRWVAAGTLTGYRVGGRHIRIDRASLDELLKPMVPDDHR